MKLILVAACAFLAVAVGAPTDVQIVRSDFDRKLDGSYDTYVETDDGSKRQESGSLVEVANEEGKPVTVLVVRGSYSYNDPDGNLQNVNYTADQDGFHPEGPSIPKNPSRR